MFRGELIGNNTCKNSTAFLPSTRLYIQGKFVEITLSSVLMQTMPEAVRLPESFPPLIFSRLFPPIKIRNIYFKNCLQCPAYFLSKGLGTNVSAETSFGLRDYRSLPERRTRSRFT